MGMGGSGTNGGDQGLLVKWQYYGLAEHTFEHERNSRQHNLLQLTLQGLCNSSNETTTRRYSNLQPPGRSIPKSLVAQQPGLGQIRREDATLQLH
jgi:hypothetical protein